MVFQLAPDIDIGCHVLEAQWVSRCLQHVFMVATLPTRTKIGKIFKPFGL